METVGGFSQNVDHRCHSIAVSDGAGVNVNPTFRRYSLSSAVRKQKIGVSWRIHNFFDVWDLARRKCKLLF